VRRPASRYDGSTSTYTDEIDSQHVTHHRSTAAVAIVSLSAGTAFMLLHAWNYFFLYDDFALVRIAGDTPVAALLTTPQIGFYRPLPFWLLHLLVQIPRLSTPAWLAASAITVHLANAALVWLLSRQLRLAKIPALVAATLFALSAPAAEGYFWLSAMFDRLCVLGTLLALNGAVMYVSAVDMRRTLIAAALVVAGAVIALGSKETAVALPLLTFATLMMTDVRTRARASIVIGALALFSVALLAWRRSMLPGFSGAYGNLGTLLVNANLAHNMLAYLKAVQHVPLPWHDVSAVLVPLVTIAPVCMAIVWLIVGAQIAWARPRALAAAVLGFTVALVPVLWAEIGPGTSASGRFMYLPGIWLALAPAVALDTTMNANQRRVPFAMPVASAIVVMLVLHTCSVAYEAQIWTTASNVSRSVVAEMKGYENFERPLYIANLPAVFVEGPYVLKDYAFAQYFGQHFKASIRVRRVALKIVGNRPEFANWLDPDDARPTDRVVIVHFPQRRPMLGEP
jgi:hypothetical protein